MSDIIPPADRRIRTLDDAAIETAAALYPVEMREPLLWLASFVREKCNGSMEVLEAKVSVLGFTTTASTFSKIFRGQWQRSASGTPLRNPVMSLDNFIQVVNRLREESRLAERAGKVPFVETETWHDIRDYIDTRRAPDQVCKMGLIIGPTGSQKSHCLKHYKTLNNHGACVHIEAPAKNSLGEFITNLASAYGIPKGITIARKIDRIGDCVNDRRTILVDNIQRLYMAGKGWNQPIFSFLQKLQDDTGCTVILCAVPEFEAVLSQGIDRGYFEQFEGRCGGKREFLLLPNYTPASDILAIADAFGLVDARKHFKALEAISRERGRIRILFNVLQKAKRTADADKQPLTIGYIREAAGMEEGK